MTMMALMGKLNDVFSLILIELLCSSSRRNGRVFAFARSAGRTGNHHSFHHFAISSGSEKLMITCFRPNKLSFQLQQEEDLGLSMDLDSGMTLR